MINENSLQDKWWWRTLKVIYILVWFTSFSIIAFLAYTERPQRIQWDSAREYFIKKINIDCQKKENRFVFNPSLAFTSLTDLRFTQPEEEYVKKVCQYGGLNQGDYTQFPSVLTRNYTVRLYFDSTGSWKSVFITLGIGFLIVFGVIEIVKTVVLYILGISVWRGMLLYGLIFIASMFSNDKKEGNNG